MVDTEAGWRMRIRVARVHAPVTALGPGVRIGVWFQGCSIGCAGCISQDTWAADDSALLDVDEVARWIRARAGVEITGLTFTGGEPSEQPAALAALLDEVAVLRTDRG